MTLETLPPSDAPPPGSDGAGSALQEATRVDLLHEIGSRLAATDALQTVRGRIVELLTDIIQCDSCFVYVLEGAPPPPALPSKSSLGGSRAVWGAGPHSSRITNHDSRVDSRAVPSYNLNLGKPKFKVHDAFASR